jgi:uncharacterized delta-60 repeat protein
MKKTLFYIASTLALATILVACPPTTDITPPNISLSSSSSNVITAGSIKLTATATDEVGVTKVEFYEGTTKIGEDTSAPYEQSIDFDLSKNGTKTYTAKAFDAANNATSSDPATTVTVNIPDTTPPTISLSSDASNVVTASTIKLTATAADNVGVTKVVFFEGTTKIGEDLSAPFEQNVDFLITDNGSKTYTAKALDAANNATSSDPIGVVVNIPPGPDIVPPTISLSSDTNNVKTASTIKLTAAATDNVGVNKVEFFDGATKLGEDSSAPYEQSVDLTATNNGTKSYTSKAFDAANNSASSDPVTVTIAIDAQAPKVTLNTPKTTITTVGQIIVTADASDDIGVTRVEFYRGTAKLSQDTSAPYELSVPYAIADNGTQSFSAKAYDAVGNVTQSSPLVITIAIPTFQIRFSPNSNSNNWDVSRGTQGTGTLILDRFNGFDLPVTVTLSNLPAGATTTTATVTFASNEVFKGLSVDVDPQATPGGPFPLVIEANGGGLKRTINTNLMIPGFRLSFTPSPVNIAQGGQVLLDVAIEPLGGYNKYNYPVIEAINLPPGIQGISDVGYDPRKLRVVLDGNAPVGQILNLILQTKDSSISNVSGSTYTIPITVTAAASGSLDGSFNIDGRVMGSFLKNPNDIMSTRAMIIQNDGKVIVGGSASDFANGLSNGFAMARYTTTGVLDTSFGGTGLVFTQSIQTNLESMALQTDDKILAVGGTYYGFQLMRYNTDGSLDTGFGTVTSGVVTQNLPSRFATAQYGGLVVQSNGKIVVAGILDTSTFVIIRFNANGTIDNSFGTNGVLTPTTPNIFVRSIQRQADNKIIAVGISNIGTQGYAITRFNEDGTLDTGFGSNGLTITQLIPADATSQGSYDYATGSEIQSNGKIVVVGSSNSSFGLVRYNQDGTLDTSFGVNGRVQSRIGLSDDSNPSVAIQIDGKIVTGGYSSLGSSNGGRFFALARYNANGVLDATFGANGTVTTSFVPAQLGCCNYYDSGMTVRIAPDGKIVLGGQRQPPSGYVSNYLLARYLP